MKIFRYIFFIVLFSVTGMYGSDLLQKANDKLMPSTQKIFLNVVDEKKTQQATLEQEKKDFESQQKEFEELLATETKELDALARRVKNEIKQSPNVLVEKTLTVLAELYQVLKDFKTVRTQIIDVIDEHIQLLTSYLNDYDFSKFKKEHKVKDYRIYYSFSDLQYLHKAIIDQEYRLTQLNEQAKNANTELGHRKQSVTAAAQAYKQKLEEHEKALKESSEVATAEGKNGSQSQQLIELLNLEERLYKNRQKLDELRLQEIEHKADLIVTKKFIAQEQLSILKDELRRIKPSVRVTEADIASAKNALTQKQQQHVRLQETYRQQINGLDAEKDEKEKALVTLSKRYNVPLGPEIDKWQFQPANLVASYVGFCQVGALNAYIRLIAIRKKFLDVQNALNEAKINDLAIQVQVKESFARKYPTTEAITQEIQKYDKPKADAQANLSLYKTKLNESDEQLNEQKKILDTINSLRTTIQGQQHKLFASMPKEYAVCLETLSRGENVVKERIELIKKLAAIDEEIIVSCENVIRQINFIITELNAMRSSWRRPEYAISWEGVTNIVPEVKAFFSDIAAYIRQFDIRAFVHGMYETSTQSSGLLFLLKLCLLLIFLFLLKWYLPIMVHLLLRKSKEWSGLASMTSVFVAGILGFVYRYFVMIALWLVLFAFLMLQVILDPYFYIIFYLFSIPYLLFVVNRFIHYMINFNAEHDYVILSKEFQRRFTVVFSVLLYATITIVFFREAFMLFMMLTNYYRSELPNVLLAVNFIIFQIALIFLISKEQILGLMQKKGAFWEWMREQVDRYYVLLLMLVIAVIVMSNPYVGFGRLVLYVLRGVLYTSLLMMLLVWLYGLGKRMASHVFFARDEEVVRERFSHAKTWFGLLIIALFIIIGFLGVFVIARIWEWQITLDDLTPLFTTSLVPGVKSPITVQSILQLIAFIMAGFMISYAINRFVLDKIFDLLLIDMGVQHTVTSIGRYIIVGIAIFFGFHMVGLGELVVYVLGALALGVGWILKEPISDFVAYFIILVQRPVKIGDYIKIDENTLGVVRQITPRAVVLRRKNSITIIVPNSYVVSHALINWNHVRKFIAFDDIIVTIHYTDDPVLVKKLLYEVVESHPKVLRNPKPIIRLDDFGEYGYKFMVRGYLSDIYTLDQWEIASDVRLAIVQRLRQENITIAIPVLSYMGHPKSGHAPVINDFEHRSANE